MVRCVAQALSWARIRVVFLVLAAMLPATRAIAAPDLGPDVPVKLVKSITVSSENIRLGDLFTGLLADQDKIVAKAPPPGERNVFSADWLANVALKYDVDWQPADSFDRVVVYRPGQAVTPAKILAAFKADLIAKGLPAHEGLLPGAALPTLIVPEKANPPLTVRESFFDAANHTFSAVAEFQGPDSKPEYLEVRGTTFPAVSVPVLKRDATRADIISADMIESADMPDTALSTDTITDPQNLIGKSPRDLVRAGQPIREIDVVRVNLVDLPVLRHGMDHNGVITANDITTAPYNATDLPADAVTTPAYLIGKSPRYLIAAGAPIRRSDVLSLRESLMAVVVRDLPRGALLQPEDVNWVPANANELAFGAIVNEADIQGRMTTRPISAGQALHEVDVTRPTVITKGKLVTIVYSTPLMKLTVRGEALEDGSAQQTIRVANAKSKAAVLAEVIDADTVQVKPLQMAIR